MTNRRRQVRQSPFVILKKGFRPAPRVPIIPALSNPPTPMIRSPFRLCAALTLPLATTAAFAQQPYPTPAPATNPIGGHQDSPLIPGTKWHVHDGERPQPAIVVPGTFPTQEKAGIPPSDAKVLFDGKDISKWKNAKGEDAKWKVEDGYMEINKTGEITTKEEFGP